MPRVIFHLQPAPLHVPKDFVNCPPVAPGARKYRSTMPRSRIYIHTASALATFLMMGIVLHMETPNALAGDRPDPRHSAPVSRILFGSCAKQDKPVPIFDTILAPVSYTHLTLPTIHLV